MADMAPDIAAVLEQERADIELNLLMFMRQPIIQGFIQELRRWLDYVVHDEKLAAFGDDNTLMSQGKVLALEKMSLDLADFVAKAKEKN